jgi:hypothetical protein
MEKTIEELRVKLKDWIRAALLWQLTHYVCGVIGVASSCYAASPYPFARGSAVFAGACFGILGFARPITVYHKFMSASRILQNALYEYDAGKIDNIALLDANQRAENFIESLDEKALPPSAKS